MSKRILFKRTALRTMHLKKTIQLHFQYQIPLFRHISMPQEYCNAIHHNRLCRKFLLIIITNHNFSYFCLYLYFSWLFIDHGILVNIEKKFFRVLGQNICFVLSIRVCPFFENGTRIWTKLPINNKIYNYTYI